MGHLDDEEVDLADDDAALADELDQSEAAKVAGAVAIVNAIATGVHRGTVGTVDDVLFMIQDWADTDGACYSDIRLDIEEFFGDPDPDEDPEQGAIAVSEFIQANYLGVEFDD